MKYFRQRTASFIISDTVLKLNQYQDDVRQPAYHILDIVVKGKVKFKIDGREGYSKDMFMEFLSAFSLAA